MIEEQRKKLKSEIKKLKSQLAIAVDGLKYFATFISHDQSYSDDHIRVGDQAEKTLKKIGELDGDVVPNKKVEKAAEKEKV